jgi:hypothetical protein
MRIPTNQGKRVWTAYALPNVDDRAQNTGITGRVSAVGRGAINEDEWRAINESGGQWKSGGEWKRVGCNGRVAGSGREGQKMEEKEWGAQKSDERTAIPNPAAYAILPAIVSRES